MCGIAAIISFNKKLSFQLQEINNITQEMSRRGPDDEGYAIFTNKRKKIFFGIDTPEKVRKAYPQLLNIKNTKKILSSVALGHRRLSILDTTPLGHQPMCDDNRYWITYNGEIYNYIELKEELKKLGHKFKTKTDTEVILKAYQEWGTECQKKFNGDWAFIIFDCHKKVLFVSRDRFGIKPLYYTVNNNCIIFASEIKSLLKYSKISSKINKNYLLNYLKNGSQEHLKETPFQNIFRFPNAHFFLTRIRKKNIKIKFKRYWKLKSNFSNELCNHKKLKVVARKYYDLLKDSVKIRLRSDVPVGFSLSGGLDSSSIVYLANEIFKDFKINKKIKTFSLIHTKKNTLYCDESKFIYLLKKKLNLVSKFTSPKISNLYKSINKVVEYMESPPDGLGTSGFFTTELAHKCNLKVTLDGQGADEQLAGYDEFKFDYLRNLKGLYFFREAYFIIKNSVNLFKDLQLVILSFLPFNLIKILAKITQKNLLRKNGLNKCLAESINRGLMNLIHYGDSQSMFFSIESRMPFMDHRLIEFNASIPSNFKIYKGWNKYYARIAFQDKLPNEIVWRKDKMGWPSPQEEWLKKPLLKHFNKDISFLNSCERKLKIKNITIKVRMFMLALFKKKINLTIKII